MGMPSYVREAAAPAKEAVMVFLSAHRLIVSASL
jgi:hypothetical protein